MNALMQAHTKETELNSEPSLTEFEIEAKAEAEEEEIIQRLVLIFQELAMRGRELTAKDQNYNYDQKPDRDYDGLGRCQSHSPSITIAPGSQPRRNVTDGPSSVYNA